MVKRKPLLTNPKQSNVVHRKLFYYNHLLITMHLMLFIFIGFTVLLEFSDKKNMISITFSLNVLSVDDLWQFHKKKSKVKNSYSEYNFST